MRRWTSSQDQLEGAVSVRHTGCNGIPALGQTLRRSGTGGRGLGFGAPVSPLACATCQSCTVVLESPARVLTRGIDELPRCEATGQAGLLVVPAGVAGKLPGYDRPVPESHRLAVPFGFNLYTTTARGRRKAPDPACVGSDGSPRHQMFGAWFRSRPRPAGSIPGDLQHGTACLLDAQFKAERRKAPTCGIEQMASPGGDS